MERRLKIQLTGPSGTGKTTLAKIISATYNIPFISGSYSDLVPSTKDTPHKDMIGFDKDTIIKQDYQVLSSRNKLFKSKDNFVSDRSYIDSITYFINKLSHRVTNCETEAFVSNCVKLFFDQCTHLICIPYTKNYFDNWDMEDNNKRVLNGYYQYEVSSIITGVLDMLGYEKSTLFTYLNNSESGLLKPGKSSLNVLNTVTNGIKNNVKVLVLDETNLQKRIEIIKRFI